MCYNVWHVCPAVVARIDVARGAIQCLLPGYWPTRLTCRFIMQRLGVLRGRRTMLFPLNEDLIARARAVLAPRRDVYWIIGAACAGKSTVCRRLARESGIALYDMDEHTYGSYMNRYTQERHPACKTWFSAPNPLAWVLSLSPKEFDALNRAVQAECLDLFAADVATAGRHPLLVDGGITHPAMLAGVISPERIFCIETTAAERVSRWETSDDRAEMKELDTRAARPGGYVAEVPVLR